MVATLRQPVVLITDINMDVCIYLSFHKILTWQVPADIELVNKSTQKNIITAQTKKTV
jgi:hypothetical protein